MGHKIKQYPKRNDGPSVIEGPSTDVLSATLNQSRISILKENRSMSSQKSRRPSLNTSATKMGLRSNPGGKTRTRKPKKKVEISLEMLNEEPKLLHPRPQDSGLPSKPSYFLISVSGAITSGSIELKTTELISIGTQKSKSRSMKKKISTFFKISSKSNPDQTKISKSSSGFSENSKQSSFSGHQ